MTTSVPAGSISRLATPAEERASSASAQASALEFLRTNHPELFVVSHRSPDIQCMNTRFGVDVTEDNLLSVLLRPHVKRICDSLAPNGRKESPTAFMYFIVKDALNMLDIDLEADKKYLSHKLGVNFTCRHECTDNTYIGGYISYLRGILGNLYKLKTRAQKAAERAAKAEDDRRTMESIAASKVHSEEMAAARHEEARRTSEYQRILRDILKKERNATLAAHGKLPVAEGDLLGIDSAAANSGDLINMEALRKKEIANDLAGLFGGARRRKSRKARKSRKSRKHSRK